MHVPKKKSTQTQEIYLSYLKVLAETLWNKLNHELECSNVKDAFLNKTLGM